MEAEQETSGLHTVQTNVNECARDAYVPTRKLLCDFIRQDLDLTGTHVGCEHGVCGACTVIFNGRPIRSCLMFAVQADGAQIETIESLANSSEDLHPVQRAFWEHHGLQCGFCTPGLILAAKKLLEETPQPSEQEIRQELAGHVCRCTGYVFIVEAIQAAAQEMAGDSTG